MVGTEGRKEWNLIPGFHDTTSFSPFQTSSPHQPPVVVYRNLAFGKYILM
jgi:hypothetical protein